MKRIKKNHWKRKNAKMKLRIFYGFICFMTILNVSSLFLVEKGISVYGFVTVIVIIVGMFLLINYLFKIYVYDPIVNVEKAIQLILEDEKFEVDDSIHENEKESLPVLFKMLLQREYTAKIMKKQAEINALQSQINPHFLYNTLETIRGQALVYGVRDIADMTKALADMFRYSISKKGSIISLKEELVNVESYLKIQKIRFHDKFELVKRIDEDTLDMKIPKLLIQPIVENALKHGLEMKRDKGRIMIEAYRTVDRLVIRIEDNGMGIGIDKLKQINQGLAEGWEGKNRAETAVTGDSIGLININERIKMVFGEEFGMVVYSAQDVGTTVEIVLGCI